MLSVSIIIPIFNVQKYIGRCIDSLLLQETENILLECILVNDCSTDSSMDIVKDKLSNYKGKMKFVIKNHLVNRGLCIARNTGINAANGDYIFFMDSDDRLEKGAIAYLVEGISEIDRSLNIDVIIGNSFICKNNKPAMIIKETKGKLVNNKEEDALRRLLTRELFHTVWNKLVKREFVLKHQLFFEEGIIDEDLLWSYMAFMYAQNILVMPKITYIYEDNPGSIMNTTSEKMILRINSRIKICNILMDNPPRKVLPEYYMYVFFILTRAVDISEKFEHLPDEIKNAVSNMRNRFLSIVWGRRFYMLFLFFLTSKKPFYYISKCRLFRRYYDRISNIILKVSTHN